MAITHAVTFGLLEGSTGVSTTTNVDVDASVKIDDTLATGTTNREYLVPVDMERMKTLLLHSTKDVTVKTNNAGTPDDTFDLKANTPIVWRSGVGVTNPITVDVTSWFVTNASGDDARFRMIAGFEPTP